MFRTILIIVSVTVAACAVSVQTEIDPALVDQLSDEFETPSTNDVIDHGVIPLLKTYLKEHNIEPVGLPGYTQSFKLGVISGYIKLQNGIIEGLNRIVRSGDVDVDYKSTTLNLKIPLSIDKLQIFYEFEGGLLGFNLTGQLSGESAGNLISLQTEIDTTTLKASLTSPPVITSEQITLKLTDESVPKWVLDMFSTIAVPHLTPLAKEVVNNILIWFVKSAVELYNNSIVLPK